MNALSALFFEVSMKLETNANFSPPAKHGFSFSKLTMGGIVKRIAAHR